MDAASGDDRREFYYSILINRQAEKFLFRFRPDAMKEASEQAFAWMLNDNLSFDMRDYSSFLQVLLQLKEENHEHPF